METKEKVLGVKEFFNRYNFILSEPDKKIVKEAGNLGKDIRVVIGYALFGTYLLHVSVA